GLFGAHELVDGAGEAAGEVVELLLGGAPLVLGDLAVLDELADIVLGLATDVADRDLGVLALGAGDLDHLAAALLGHRRQVEPQLGALVGGVDAEVGVADGVLDVVDLRGVERLDQHHARLGDGDRGHLRERRRCAVVVDGDPVEHGGGGAAGADDRELLFGVLDGPLHLLLGFEEGVGNHAFLTFSCSLTALLTVPSRYSSSAAWIKVPSSSPTIARRRFSSPSTPKTRIGRALSLQRLKAVWSTTMSSRLRASSKVRSSRR